jgi:hypothetical protein
MQRRTFGFDPARDIANILCWANPSNPSSVVRGSVDDGGTLASRIISSRGVLDLVEHTGSGYSGLPTIDPPTGRTLLYFGGHPGNTLMTNNKNVAAMVLTGATMVLCGDKTGNNDDNAYYAYIGGGSFDSHHADSGGTVYDDFASNTRNTFPNATNFAGRHIITVRGKNNQWDLWLDAVQQFSTKTNTFSMAQAVTGTGELPRRAGGANNVCEVIIIGRYITDAELHQVNRYLAKRWKVPLQRSPVVGRKAVRSGRRLFPAAAAVAAGYRARVVRWG